MTLIHDRTDKSRSIFVSCAPTDPEHGFDQLDRVRSILRNADLSFLARELGYQNRDSGVHHLEVLRDHKWLGLDEGKGTYDLRFTTIELVLAILKIDAADKKQLDMASEQCELIQGFFRQRREDQAFAHIRVVSEYAPRVTSFFGGLRVNAVMKRRAPALCDYPADQILGKVGQQIRDHYRQYRNSLSSTGKWLGYGYFFRQGLDPIEFDIGGVPVKSTVIEAIS